MTAVLLSGCADNEYSYDALIEGQYHGAMTYAAMRAINEATAPLTYRRAAHSDPQHRLPAGYPQHPKLEGRMDDKRSLLFGTKAPN